MAIPLNVLLVEDVEADADLVMAELRRAGFAPHWKRVETETDFLAELNKIPDLIVSDYSLPEFSGLRATQLLQSSGLDIPFILVSGTVGEDVAVEAMKYGATDYLLKDRMTRLGGAVERALREAKERNAHKQAEADRDRLAAILEATPDLVSFSDPAGRILYFNRAARSLLGIGSDEDVTKTSIADFIPDPARNPILTEGIPTAIRQGTWSGETVLVSRDGRNIPVSQIILAHQAPDGTLEFLSTIMRDITERKQIEGRLQRKQTELQVLFDLMPAMIWFKDTQNGILRVNQRVAKAAGKPVAEIEGKPSVEIYPAEAAKYYADDLEVIRSGTPKLGIIEKLKDRDGNELWVQTDKVPYCDKDDKVIGVVVMAQDITMRKLAEAELEQTHRQLLEASRQAGMAEFATGVLHNVGNVLNSVNVASTCLSDSLKKSKSASLAKVVALMRAHEADLGDFFTNDPKGKQLPGYLAQLADHLAREHANALDEIAELQQNVEHIKALINVQQDSAIRSRLPEMLKLTDQVEDTLKMNANALERAGIQVDKEFEPVPPILTDRHKVLQILVNLVRNAMQACEGSDSPEKRLTVRVKRAAGRASIEVADNGSGIRSDHLSQIFTHGFTTKKNGHGFGLHSAALSAKEMGGSLTARSEGSGKGATFTLTLPLEDWPGSTHP